MKKFVSLMLSLVLTLSLALFAACTPNSGDGSNSASCQHTETETRIEVPATCTTNGKQVTVCKNCGKQVGDIVDIPKLGHEYAAGFCIHTGCTSIDKDNNRFYANTLVSLLDTTYYSLDNVGDVTVTHGDEVYTLKNVNLLGGKSEGALTADDNQLPAKDLFSVKIKGEGNLNITEGVTATPIDATVRLVNTDSELKLIVVSNGEEKLYARVNNEVVVKTLEYIKNNVVSAGEELPDTGITGGTAGTEVDYEAMIKSFIDSIRTADGTDATVSQINTVIHNVVVAIADIKTAPEGYEIALSTEKLKAFNHRLAVQTVEDFVTDMFGAGTYTNLIALLQMAASASAGAGTGTGTAGAGTGTGAELPTVDIDFNGIIADCPTTSLYGIIKKYIDKSETETDYEAKVNEVIDSFKGLSISYILDGTGNILKAKVKAEGFTPIEDATITIGGAQSTIYGFKIDGEFEINYKRERITGDKYVEFDDALNTADTDKTAGEYEGFIDNEFSTCKKITYTVDAKGNIVSAISYFAINDSEGVTKYYKVVCNDPVTIVRTLDEGNIVYTITNILVEKDYSVDLGIEVYATDENWENATLIADKDVISSITSDIDEVEFLLEKPDENPTENPTTPEA